ncbi:hypothetical protein VE02_07063 [Pseudogymnoascus sp. 03VT05]|nr:hypothetical protein VE02_07063 [Pseudogymnoascus sp. 03VT05]
MLGWAIFGGDDGPNVLETKALSKDPSKHGLYGKSMKWKTAVDDVSLGLGPAEFDNWLWRREKPRLPGQPADLRSQVTFPLFYGLPHDKDITTEFYSSTDGPTLRPRRHWLFLAEISDFFILERYQIDIQDVDGVTVPLIFRTQGRGSEFVPSKVQIGYTVAILYAQRRGPRFAEPRILLEESSNMKIFPTSLRQLLELNDQVQRYSGKTNGLRTCHGCGKQAASLKKCTKCSLFWYCGGDCQIRGWNEKDHKSDCKLLRDDDLKGLFSFDWDKFEDCVRFPLNYTMD